MKPSPLRLSGLVTATFTPMLDDGALNLSAVPALVDHLCRWDVAGLYVVGSTGEGVSLSNAERCAAVEAFIAASAGRVPVIVQVGHNSLTDARELAAHAARAGAAAISATPPSYFKPATADLLARCMADIAAAAPSLPFYYYHIPHITGVQTDMLEFLRLAAEHIPTFAGVKYTSTALNEMLAAVEFRPAEFEILHGFDELLLAGLAMGARAAVGSTYNFAAPIYHKILAAFARADLTDARRWQSRACAMIRCVISYDGLAGQKAAMALIGQDCGPVRLPLSRLSPERINAMRAELEAMGFFEWIQ